MSGVQARDIALFPLRTVLFTGGALPLRVFEPRYLGMVKECLRDQQPFGVCLIREGMEVGAPAVPEEVGCLARIAHWDMQQLGVLELLVRGGRRFRIRERRVQGDGLARARIDVLAEEEDAEVPSRYAACVSALKRILADIGTSHLEPPLRFESSVWVSARLAEVLPLPLQQQQRLLELDSGLQRLRALQALLANARGRAGGAS